MDNNAWVGQITAPVAVAVGILICFWGYLILKVTLGIMGFIVGAMAGSEIGLALVPGNNGIALLCAVILGAIGAVLCIWLFWLGIFLLGASAGAAMASAAFNGAGYQAQTILILIAAIVVGVIAVVVKRFMIIFSTAFAGAYLIVAGILHLMAGTQGDSPLWVGQVQSSSAGTKDYVALAIWVLLGLTGMVVQFRGARRRDVVVREEKRSA